MLFVFRTSTGCVPGLRRLMRPIRSGCSGTVRGSTRPLLFGCGASSGATHHQGDLPADIVEAQAAACGIPEHGPVHGAKDRQPEGMPVAVGAQRQIVDKAGEDLLVVVALTDELSNTLEIIVARRREDRARHATTEQYPEMRNDGLVEPLPGFVDPGYGGLDLLTHGCEAFLVHREEQVLLGWKVIVQRTGQNA